MGPPSQQSTFTEFSPFNDTSYYHGTLGSHCSATDGGISQQQREVCWLANLGDLKQENPFVTDQLVKWMSGLQQQYGFDGVRIDTVPYVPKSFWKALKTGALQQTYAVGECLVPISMHEIAGYQRSSSEGVNGPLLDGILNYPLFAALRSAFQQGGSLQVDVIPSCAHCSHALKLVCTPRDSARHDGCAAPPPPPIATVHNTRTSNSLARRVIALHTHCRIDCNSNLHAKSTAPAGCLRHLDADQQHVF
jgi:hypothetical protein